MTTFTTQDRQDAQRTPLTQEQIDNILESLDVYIDTHAGVMQFARAIERAHGIGEQAMTQYEFMVSGDAEQWTEEEKQLVIKRHEKQKKEFNERWKGMVFETVGKHFAIKTE